MFSGWFWYSFLFRNHSPQTSWLDSISLYWFRHKLWWKQTATFWVQSWSQMVCFKLQAEKSSFFLSYKSQRLMPVTVSYGLSWLSIHVASSRCVTRNWESISAMHNLVYRVHCRNILLNTWHNLVVTAYTSHLKQCPKGENVSSSCEASGILVLRSFGKPVCLARCIWAVKQNIAVEIACSAGIVHASS